MVAKWLGTLLAGAFVVLSLTFIGPSIAAQIGVQSTQDKAETSSEASARAIETPEVTIQAESPISEATADQRAQKFRDTLGTPREPAVSERQLGDGVMEITTRLARFCARSLPLTSQNGPGGNTTLVVPCASF